MMDSALRLKTTLEFVTALKISSEKAANLVRLIHLRSRSDIDYFFILKHMPVRQKGSKASVR